MKTGSLRVRLLLAGAVSVVVALTLSAIGLTLLFERHVERRVESELEVYLAQIVSSLDRDDEGRLFVAAAPSDPRFETPLSGLYWEIDAGERVLRSRSLWDVRLQLPKDELSQGSVHRHHIPGPGNTELLAVERMVTLPARLGSRSIRASVAQDAADITRASHDFAVDLAPYLLLLALFLIGAVYGEVTIGLRPLVRLRAGLAAVRQGTANRLGTQFPDEIQPLAAELDALLDARDNQIAKARARAGDLAHGLKTPLQVLAGDIDRLKAKGEAEIAGEIEQVASAMRRHVEHELTRARIAGGHPDATAKVAESVRNVVAVVARTPSGARLEWSIAVADDLVARITAEDLAEALGNLVENAARHARHRVDVFTERVGEKVAITVRDDGPGIPDDQIRVALKRGQRLDNLGGGDGLGLAIVGDIAQAWGGTIDLANATTGLAATFTVPVAK